MNQDNPLNSQEIVPAEAESGPVVRTSFYQLMLILLVIISAVFLVAFLPQLPRFSQVLSCVFVSLVTAIVIFGFLPASGVLRWRGVRLGGAAAAAVTVLWLLLRWVDEGLVSVRGIVLLESGSQLSTAPAGTDIYLLGFGRTDHQLKLTEASAGQFAFGSIPPETKRLRFHIRIPQHGIVEKVVDFTPGALVELRIVEELPPASACELEQFGPDLGAAHALENLGFIEPPRFRFRARTTAADSLADRLILEVSRENAIPIPVHFTAELSREPGSRYVVQGWLSQIQLGELSIPYGNLAMQLSFRDILGGSLLPLASRGLNHIYFRDFRDGSAAFSPASHHIVLTATTPDGEVDGITIENHTRTRGFVSALLKQRFALRLPLVVGGEFTLDAPSFEVPAVDITFGDTPNTRRGDLVQVFFGAQSADTFSIKVRAEKERRIGDTPERYFEKNARAANGKHGNVLRHNERRVAFRAQPTLDAPSDTPNFFQVRLEPCPDDNQLIWCRAYLSQEPLNLRSPQESDLVHQRTIASNLLNNDDLRIRLRVWRSGRCTLRQLTVAEIPKADTTVAANVQLDSSVALR